MDLNDTNRELQSLYDNWRAGLTFSQEDSLSLGPPLLLSATKDYCEASRRIMLFGQETNGWQWYSNLRKLYPRYPDWTFSDLDTLQDFIDCADSVRALTWGYEQFNFAEKTPHVYRSPFWRTFRDVQGWPDVGVIWNNISKVDGAPSGSSALVDGELRARLLSQQSDLLRAEVSVLRPHVCLFFTGPFYDPLIRAAFPDVELVALGDFPTRQIAKIVAANVLPDASFRTYHPNYLVRAQKGHFVDYLREASLDPKTFGK